MSDPTKLVGVASVSAGIPAWAVYRDPETGTPWADLIVAVAVTAEPGGVAPMAGPRMITLSDLDPKNATTLGDVEDRGLTTHLVGLAVGSTAEEAIQAAMAKSPDV